MLGLQRVPRSFYLRPTLQVAKELLGLFLIRKEGRHTFAGRIVEVEAYLGSGDPASHAYRGRTPRNAVMFMEGGHLYVYFTYGMHFCANVVTEGVGTGHAVLLRAVEPVKGIVQMRKNRGTEDVHTLCSGPARLCQAFAINRKDNGTDLCSTRIWIGREKEKTLEHGVGRTTRVGISKGRQHRWRLFIKDSPFVSKGKPS
jgi:DNA-3-methyladenine glycosylase